MHGLTGLLAVSILSLPVCLAAAETPRTIYVTATDGMGAPVPDLGPADFVVKEGGKERRVTSAEPASVPMRLTLAIEERLIVDGQTRLAIWEFIKRIAGRASIRLLTIGLRPETIVDYSGDPSVLVAAINKLSLNPNRNSNLAEGVLDIAESLAKAPPRRPVLLVVAVSGGQSGVDSKLVLDRIRQSGAMMYAATVAEGQAEVGPALLMEQSGREEILGDGPKQSGGRRIDVHATSSFAQAMQQIASDLLAQYAITYELPDGVKPDKRLNVSVKRRGVSLRAPSAIPDR